jgi:hypothetical protein
MRFPGIGADAKALNVSPSFLWLCLTGRRDNSEVMEAYRNLKRQQARQILEETENKNGRLTQAAYKGDGNRLHPAPYTHGAACLAPLADGCSPGCNSLTSALKRKSTLLRRQPA